MILPDVNMLVHAVNADFPQHDEARVWLDNVMNGSEPVGLPWAVITGFVRISTHPRILPQPLSFDDAMNLVEEWFAQPVVVVLDPGPDYTRHFAQLCRAAGATGNLITDAHLAALAIEYDCDLLSNDNDFAKFPGLRWVDPLAS